MSARPPPEPIDELVFDWNRSPSNEVASQGTPELRDETLSVAFLAPFARRPDPAERRAHFERTACLGMGSVALGALSSASGELEAVLAAGRGLGGLGPGARIAAFERPGPDVSGVVEAAARLADIAHREVDLDLAVELPSRGLDAAVRRAEALAVSLGLVFDLEGTSGPELPEVLAFPLDRVVLDGGPATSPEDAARCVRDARARVARAGRRVRVAWRGQNRRGLAVAAALAAADAGADRLDGTFLGFGEAGGLSPIDQIALNLDLDGRYAGDLSTLVECCERVAAALGWPVPRSYPLVGRDAFRTATGVHAAAIVKAFARGDPRLADLVYSGVPAGRYRREQVIEIGPMSGMWNVRFWLAQRGIPFSEDLAEGILALAKASSRVLDDEEVRAFVGRWRADG